MLKNLNCSCDMFNSHINLCECLIKILSEPVEPAGETYLQTVFFVCFHSTIRTFKLPPYYSWCCKAVAQQRQTIVKVHFHFFLLILYIETI